MRRVLTPTVALILLLAIAWLSRIGHLAADSASTLPYNTSAGYRLALPALDVGAGWTTTIYVQNMGAEPTAARVTIFPVAEGGCQAAKPLAVRCVEAIAPGAAWRLTLNDAHELAGASAALVTSVAAGVNVCDGGVLPPGEPLAVVVRRTRSADGRVTAGVYPGIAPAVAGFWDSEQQAYVSLIPWLASGGDRNTTLAVQNIGLECASGIEMALWRSSDCGFPAHTLTLPDVPPGTSARVRIGDRVEGDFEGWAWVRSPQPLAVVLDRWQGDAALLSTHVTGRGAGAMTLDASLVSRDAEGWNTVLRVQNTGARASARLETRYRGPDGSTAAEQAQPVCPGGTAVQETANMEELPAPFLGSALLTSAELEQPEMPHLVAVADLISTAGRAAAYRVPNGAPEEAQTADVALPWLARALPETVAGTVITHTTRIAIVNQNLQPGEGQVVLSLYNAAGLVTAYQPPSTLGPGGMALIDLAEIPGLDDGWLGSGLVHFLTTQPGPPAVAAVVLDNPAGEGDPSAAYAGIAAIAQAQPTPTPTPTILPSPTATPTPLPSPTPPGTSAASYLPLIRR